MVRGRRILARLVVVVLLSGCLVAVIPGPAHAGLTPRNCKTIPTGDQLRRLDVCARGWVDKLPATSTRGVYEMHTYRWLGNGANQWVDSRSQSITLNSAVLDYGSSSSTQPLLFGNDETQKCRINGPGGPVGCSVPNTDRVAFYSPHHDPWGQQDWHTIAYDVSWRDDRGLAHYYHFLYPCCYLESPRWAT